MDVNNIWVKLGLTNYFGYIALILMSLMRIVAGKYGEWEPFGPQFMYPFISLKIKPSLWKIILVFATQTYIDHMLFPNFNKAYEGEKLEGYQNHDIAINAVICIVFYLVCKIVPHLGLQNKKKLAK